MKSSLFPAIPLKVVSSQLECAASAKAKPRFELSVAALTPVERPSSSLRPRPPRRLRNLPITSGPGPARADAPADTMGSGVNRWGHPAGSRLRDVALG